MVAQNLGPICANRIRPNLIKSEHFDLLNLPIRTWSGHFWEIFGTFLGHLWDIFGHLIIKIRRRHLFFSGRVSRHTTMMMMVTKFNSYVAYFLSPLFITVSCWGNAGFWSHKKLDYSRNSALLSVMASYVQKKMSDPIVVMLSHLHSIFFLIIGGSSIVVLVLLVWRSLHSLHPWSSGQNCLYELKTPESSMIILYYRTYFLRYKHF